MTTKTKTPTKADLINLIEQMRIQIEQTQSQNTILQNQLNTISMGFKQPNDSDNIKSNERVTIKSCMLGKTPFMINGQDYIIQNIDDKLTLTQNEANALIAKSKYRKQFQQGLIYFTDDKWYEYYQITKPEILLESKIIEILESSNLQSILTKMTNNKQDMVMTHTLLYRFADLLKRKIVHLDENKRNIIEKFFDVLNLSGIIYLVEFKNKDIL